MSLRTYLATRYCLPLVVCFFCLPVTVASGDQPKFVVAGYIPDYRMAAWSQDTGPLTDLIYFGMSVQPDGKFNQNAVPEQHIAALQTIKAKSKCRLTLTVGGWEKSQGFPAVATSPQRRSQFVRDAAAFCLRNGFDGIDYDWEHPKGLDEIKSFTSLLQDSRKEFSRHRLLVTIAQAGWQNLGRETYDAVDRVHLMSYDHDFPQATFEKSKADVERLISAGCPRNKIVLGLPFYGRNQEGTAKTYADIRRNAEPANDVVDGFAINSPATITRKLRYARQHHLGGVMIWELGQDIAGPESLLHAIGKAIAP